MNAKLQYQYNLVLLENCFSLDDILISYQSTKKLRKKTKYFGQNKNYLKFAR